MKITKQKKGSLTFFLILLISLSSLLSGNVNLSQSRDMSELPFIIIRPNGEIMVAWTEGHFNSCGTILYRTYTDKNGWSSTKVAAEKLYSAAFPQLDTIWMAALLVTGKSTIKNTAMEHGEHGKVLDTALDLIPPGLGSMWMEVGFTLPGAIIILRQAQSSIGWKSFLWKK